MYRQKRIVQLTITAILLAFSGLAADTPGPAPSYAIYAEFARDANKLMKSGLNRRVFNVVEAQSGSGITLNPDGSFTLEPGTYRMTGMSIVTMQTTFAPATPHYNTNYPGYCALYPAALETDSSRMKHLIGIGTPQTALDTTPSFFDVIYTTSQRANFAVGHQSGADLHNEVYLSVYSVAGTTSDLHVFARIAIAKLFDSPKPGRGGAK
jgi:hypothetical protein